MSGQLHAIGIAGASRSETVQVPEATPVAGASAILDRLLHNAHRLALKGASTRTSDTPNLDGS